jgi:hypothetical protein
MLQLPGKSAAHQAERPPAQTMHRLPEIAQKKIGATA